MTTNMNKQSVQIEQSSFVNTILNDKRYLGGSFFLTGVLTTLLIYFIVSSLSSSHPGDNVSNTLQTIKIITGNGKTKLSELLSNEKTKISDSELKTCLETYIKIKFIVNAEVEDIEFDKVKKEVEDNMKKFQEAKEKSDKIMICKGRIDDFEPYELPNLDFGTSPNEAKDYSETYDKKIKVISKYIGKSSLGSLTSKTLEIIKKYAIAEIS